MKVVSPGPAQEERRRVSLEPLGQRLERLLDFGLYQSEGGREGRVYIQMRGIKQERVRCGLERRDRPFAIPPVPVEDFGQQTCFVCVLSPALQFDPTAMGAYLRCRIHEQLGDGVWTDDGTDIAAINDSAPGATRRMRRKLPLKLQQRFSHL